MSTEHDKWTKASKEKFDMLVKKKLASINITLLLLLGFFAVHRGIDPCSNLFTALTGMGVSDIVVEASGGQEAGPPAPGQVILYLADGQSVKILQNGTIQVEKGEQ